MIFFTSHICYGWALKHVNSESKPHIHVCYQTDVCDKSKYQYCEYSHFAVSAVYFSELSLQMFSNFGMHNEKS